MMRIVMLCASVSHRGAGVAKAVEGISGALAARGHDIRVLALDDWAWGEEKAHWTGAPVTVFPVRGPATLGYAPGMLSALRAAEPDLVHLHGLWMHSARDAQRWSRQTDRPFIVSPHGMLAPAALEFSKGKKRLARLLYHDRTFASAAAYHATSDSEAEQIRAFGLTQPIILYPNGIDVLERPGAVTRAQVVLSLGRLHPVKGLDILLDAWALLEPRHPAWRLRIVGPDDNGYADNLRRRAAALGLMRVSVEGPVYGVEKFRLLASAGLFALPSRTENFGLTVVESLMMGTPVIASQSTPWEALVKKGCGDWVQGEPKALADAMGRTMELPEDVRQKMGDKGRSWVIERFCWDNIAARAEEGYAKLMAGD